MDIYNEFFKAAMHRYETHVTGISSCMRQRSVDYRYSYIWTSCATRVYITITPTASSKSGKCRVSYVLCTFEVAERHTGINIATKIKEVAEVCNFARECSSDKQCIKYVC